VASAPAPHRRFVVGYDVLRNMAEGTWLERTVLAIRRGWRRVAHLFPFIGWVSYPPILLTYVAALLVVGGAGVELGIPSLIWHERLLTQLLSGVAVAFLCLHLALVGYLLDSRDEPKTEATVGDLARYVVWPLLLLVVVLGIFLPRHWSLPAHGLLVVLPPLAIFLAAAALLRSLRPLAASLGAGVAKRLLRHGFRERWGNQRPIDAGAHALQALSMLALGGLYLAAWIFRPVVPAAPAVILGLGLMTGIWGFFAFWMRRYRVLGLSLLIFVAVLLGATRDVPPAGVKEASLHCSTRAPQIDDRQALEQWKALTGVASPPLVVVTTSGGASRSALWTVTVLHALEERIPGFLRHVRVITGASGGMVGAAHYVSAIERDRPVPDFRQVRDAVTADSLTAVARALILPGLDRGRALELSWEEQNPRLKQPFVGLAQGEREGWRPSLIFSPMMVEDGRRLIISNLGLGAVTRTENDPSICLAAQPCDHSISGVELLACPGVGLDRLSLSTVARLSATFPWVTSAALLPSKPARRIVDAGYYDNYGVDMAVLWIRKNAPWLHDNTSGVLVVQLRDMPAQRARNDVLSPPGPGVVTGWYSALSTPLEGGLSARESSMSFRNDDELGLLAGRPDLAAGDRGFVATSLFELDGEVPLSWYLSRAQVASMKQPDPDSIAQVAKWFGARRR
jgi:hypothetical protein